ncbi:uncharacterized protein N0V89_009402 [Didymosphaeria variabile]|uniref:xylan 1,4-beta-xylosidase n=1 Tax=Didymosphaeria variabile TaxID=1932322 RepID=A0A9W9C7L2_9PLEO|nr:uncharacterized protein N0V89_009402 [Didymosphaeria variabile]KAJ4348030.1 hypothetical protein N0V89_009402 [Didymosphaeria variabile]
MGLDPSQRAKALVSAMTIEEKLANLVDHSQGAERLGLPKYDWWSEALHGVAGSPGVHFADHGNYSSATSFPLPITISAAFNDGLVQAIGHVIGTEARAFANAGRAGLDFWTPNINPFKDPRWGRGLETPGEDPFRISKYVEALLKGMEWSGKNPNTTEKRQILATCKHYAAYDLERWNGVVRYSFDAIVSMQDLVEYYLPPFKQCARDSNVASIMCSYNSVNGTPACANEYLMQTVLRDHWNWTKHNNYVVSDCNAVHNIYADHKWVQTAAQAAGKAFSAGTDNVCEAGGWTTDVVGAFNQSRVSEEVIDRALRRQYEGLIRADYFAVSRDDVVGPRSYGWEYVNTEQAQTLALQAATEGTVLLKNDGTLPLRLAKNQSIAVIGFWANDTSDRMLGNYYGKPPVYRTPLWAVQNAGFQVNYATAPSSGTGNYRAAIQAAQNSDVVLYFGGIDTTFETEDKDRTTIAWPEIQRTILRELSGLGKKIIVVQLGTSIDNTPLLVNEKINSILWVGYPGMYGGPAALDIITGNTAPAGRLPVTQYPANYTEQVPMTDMSLRPSSKNPGRTYKWYSQAIQEFGSSLHYTNFTIRFDPRYTNRTYPTTQILAGCSFSSPKDRCPFTPHVVQVRNSGDVASDFIALAFVTTKAGPEPYPIKELASYKRLANVKPGEERPVQLGFTIGNLARVNERGDTVLYAGEYCLVLDVPEQDRACFELTGADMVLDVWPQPKVGNATRGH